MAYQLILPGFERFFRNIVVWGERMAVLVPLGEA